jgi:hypothetical protein
MTHSGDASTDTPARPRPPTAVERALFGRSITALPARMPGLLLAAAIVVLSVLLAVPQRGAASARRAASDSEGYVNSRAADGGKPL